MTGALPVTTVTAGLIGLLHVALSLRVTLTRIRTGDSIGTGGAGVARFGEEAGASRLLVAARAHANLAENAPLALILLGIAEYDLGQVWFVFLIALLLLVARVMHPIGLGMRAPNPLRAGGAILTLSAIGLGAVHALVRAAG